MNELAELLVGARITEARYENGALRIDFKRGRTKHAVRIAADETFGEPELVATRIERRRVRTVEETESPLL